MAHCGMSRMVVLPITGLWTGMQAAGIARTPVGKRGGAVTLGYEEDATRKYIKELTTSSLGDLVQAGVVGYHTTVAPKDAITVCTQ
eukprot:6467097-Amphidinium_carterae.2